MKFRIGNKMIYLRVLPISKEAYYTVGVESGLPEKNQFWLADYDKYNPEKELPYLMKKYDLKQGIIIESSPGKWQVASFTPLPFKTVLCITADSHADKNHKSFLMRNGCSTLRLTAKREKGFPRFAERFINPEGKHFYDYDRENAYLKLLEKLNGKSTSLP